MKKYPLFLLISFLSFFVSNVYGKRDRTLYPVEWNQISKLAKKNPDSVRTLIQRFIRPQIDTTLTYKERTIAYAGQTYLPEYRGVELTLMDVDNYLEQNNTDAAKNLLKEILKKCPLNFHAIDEMLHIIFNELNDSTKNTSFTKDDLKYYSHLGSRIMNTIAATGDGSKEHPFDVIAVRDEYLFMFNYLEIEHGSQHLIEGKVPTDMFDVKGKSKYYGKDSIYFDITRVLELERI